jgi:hypothetical protein
MGRPIAFAWLLIVASVVLGGLVLRGWTRARTLRAAKLLEDPRYLTMPFSDLPAWVRAKLSPLRDAIVGLGFTELTSFTLTSSTMNYSCVLASSDGEIVAETWISRLRGLDNLFTLFHPWDSFKRNLLASPCYAFVTKFPGLRTFRTTPVENLAHSDNVQVVGPEVSLDETLELHREAARSFARRRELAPIAVTTKGQFLDIERLRMQAIAALTLRKLGR